ncbi:DEAD/DEAH box helicase [Salipaludibacillus sp. CF4.18]|uniref:DEAD/DEAH box helicase n=1 Tax=Salipaludibacillus sp. CF4.18 TaxID=3373081 RepID=UPI003EE7F3B7
MRFYVLPLSESTLKNHKYAVYLPHDPQGFAYWLIPEQLLEPMAELPLTRLSDYETDIADPQVNQTFIPNPNLEAMLRGGRLLLDEVTAIFSLQEIHEHVCHGYIHYSSGIVPQSRKLACSRCGTSDPFLVAQFECARCNDMCTYCRSCIMMGRVSSCTPFLTWHAMQQLNDMKMPRLGWQGELSPAQKKAADALVKQVNTPLTENHSFLTWAVCGAGKTEMLFPAILAGLEAHKPVLIATPRTDVVLELLPRLRAAFPNTVVEGFYGGADDRYAKAQLLIATTHQLLRYHDYFPIVIIDEVDAFPFSYDEKLHFAVKKASLTPSLTIYLTATPPKELKSAAENGKIPHVKVPRRYHGHPLPVPKLMWIGNWMKNLQRKKKLPYHLLHWIKHTLEQQKQIFLFLPRIDLQPAVIAALRYVFPEVSTDSVYANDEERREKVMRFREGNIRILVTTTILERGVTVKGVQVGVLGAEDRIFTESALVQIAGRVGRSADEPTGDIIFFHHGKTIAMVEAIRHIKAMNQEY